VPFDVSKFLSSSSKASIRAEFIGKNCNIENPRTQPAVNVLKRRNSVADGLLISAGTTDRIVARTLRDVLRADSGTPASYSSTSSWAFLFHSRSSIALSVK
jgi:hypothetical protein